MDRVAEPVAAGVPSACQRDVSRTRHGARRRSDAAGFRSGAAANGQGARHRPRPLRRGGDRQFHDRDHFTPLRPDPVRAVVPDQGADA